MDYLLIGGLAVSLHGVERVTMDAGITVAKTTDFPPGDRTYFVSDARQRAFRQLIPEQKLRWVEKLAAFLRVARADMEKARQVLPQS